MPLSSNYRNAFENTKVLLPPKHLLSTFGSTTLRYILLSGIEGDPQHCRLRKGSVSAERPKILSPEFWKQRFEGFEDSDDVTQMMEQIYGDAFRSLEYGFKNTLEETSLETESLQTTSDRVRKVVQEEGSPRTAVIQGPDQFWSISVMRFILDMSVRSFPSNVRELDERGLFQPLKRAEERNRIHIEKLFSRAQQDSTVLNELGKFLKEVGLFSEYEDRFFSAFR